MLSKPEHVKKKIWEQHLDWMDVMREGSLNEKLPGGAAKQPKTTKTQDADTTGGKPSSSGAKQDQK